MSEFLAAPDPSRFPALETEPSWVRTLAAGIALSRIFRAGGEYPAAWHTFRSFGPLDARFDPHPLPTQDHQGEGVMYVSPEAPAEPASPGAVSPFAVSLLEVFQQHRMIRRSFGEPTLAVFETVRPLRLLDLSDSDWVTAAGANASITAGERGPARVWSRAIRTHYPELDGVIGASSIAPSARIAALWQPALSALPRHPVALLRLDRAELTAPIDAIAARYGYLVLD